MKVRSLNCNHLTFPDGFKICPYCGLQIENGSGLEVKRAHSSIPSFTKIEKIE